TILFFLMLQHPPPPPLFPYTTLFRSIAEEGCDAQHSPRCHAIGIVIQRAKRKPISNVFEVWTAPPQGSKGTQQPTSAGALSRGKDRKSTRLNSSHDQISYAVFCLKKK